MSADAQYRSATRVSQRLRKLQAECDAWNAVYPVGAEVVLSRDDGVQLRTKTLSEAQVLSGHSAVIWLEGASGCYLLDRVRRAEPLTFTASGGAEHG